jgi:hypothetical protein
MAIDLATAQVRAIRRQISQAHVPNALGLGFCDGLRYDFTLLNTRATGNQGLARKLLYLLQCES